MADYNEYLSEIKKPQAGPDFARLHAQIEQKAGRRAVRARLALAGTLAVFILAFAVYYLYPSGTVGNNDVLISYVFEQQETIDGPILEYVLND
jgi:dolichol kinase